MLQRVWKLPLLDQLIHSDRIQIAHSPDDEVQWGYFDSHEEAKTALRPNSGLPHQNDNIEPGDGRAISQVSSFDYPVMFFLQKLSMEGKLKIVTDLPGGSRLKYAGYRTYVDFPDDLIWQVVERGTSHHNSRHPASGHGALRFHDDIAGTKPCSALICCGGLPHLNVPFERILRGFRTRPPMVILNEVFVARKAGLYMLETVGGRQMLHRALALPELERLREDLGYKLLSRWDIPERTLVLDPSKGSEAVQMMGEAWSI